MKTVPCLAAAGLIPVLLCITTTISRAQSSTFVETIRFLGEHLAVGTAFNAPETVQYNDIVTNSDESQGMLDATFQTFGGQMPGIHTWGSMKNVEGAAGSAVTQCDGSVSYTFTVTKTLSGAPDIIDIPVVIVVDADVSLTTPEPANSNVAGFVSSIVTWNSQTIASSIARVTCVSGPCLREDGTEGTGDQLAIREPAMLVERTGEGEVSLRAWLRGGAFGEEVTDWDVTVSTYLYIQPEATFATEQGPVKFSDAYALAFSAFVDPAVDVNAATWGRIKQRYTSP